MQKDAHDAAPDGGELTAEESAAYEAMQNEGAPPDPETPAESAQDEPDAEGPSPAGAATDEGAPPSDAQDGKPGQDWVPQKNLHAIHSKYKETRDALEAVQRELAEFKAGQPKPEPEPIPDPIMEPEKYNAWVQGQTSKPAEEVRQLREQMQQQQQQQHVAAAVQRAEAAFVKDTPDYYDALDYVVKSRKSEFEMWGATPEQAEQQVQNEIWNTAETAVRMGMSPAEMAYRIATSRGYRRSDAPASNNAQNAEAAKVAALAKSQENASSLAGTGGPAAGGGLTAEDMANMPQSQIDKLSDEQIMKAMGA